MAIKVEGLAPLIQVFDMPRSVAFYRDVIGFDVVATSPARGRDDFDWAMLELDGTHLMLNTAYEEHSRPVEPDASRVRAHADTGLFFGCRDVDAVHSHLREKGVSVEEPHVAPYGMKQLYVSDPDGYVICFQWRAA